VRKRRLGAVFCSSDGCSEEVREGVDWRGRGVRLKGLGRPGRWCGHGALLPLDGYWPEWAAPRDRSETTIARGEASLRV
jgi:hypothetical protein